MNISAKDLDFKELNEQIRRSDSDITIEDCYGQRFIGSGESSSVIEINGIPGNALGAYLDGALIKVNGNVQDAVGDTMNAGKIVIDGNAGDALGYAMRGGQIYVKGDTGYRTGIHMKQYKDKKPVIVVGGKAGSFLGEYLAGGLIIVLGIGADKVPTGNFTGTGMHGGQIFIRTDKKPSHLPKQVVANIATKEEMEDIFGYIKEYSDNFGADVKEILNSTFYLLKPNATNPYKQLYTAN